MDWHVEIPSRRALGTPISSKPSLWSSIATGANGVSGSERLDIRLDMRWQEGTLPEPIHYQLLAEETTCLHPLNDRIKNGLNLIECTMFAAMLKTECFSLFQQEATTTCYLCASCKPQTFSEFKVWCVA